MVDAIKDLYAGYEFKKTRLPGFDSGEHLRSCVLKEVQTESDDQLEFKDRALACIAGFRDSHFSISASKPYPNVSVPISARRVRGKVRIVAKNTLVQAKECTPGVCDIDLITVGDEVISIDGAPVALAVSELVPYLSSSSDQDRINDATIDLFNREFHYPDQKTVTIGLKDPQGREYLSTLEWTFAKGMNRFDAEAYFTKIGFTEVPKDQFEVWGEDHAKMGTLFEGKHFHDYTEQNHLDRKKSAVMRTGLVTIHKKTAGYLELKTFDATVMYHGLKKSRKEDFGKLVRRFIQELDEGGLDLILDLRGNIGGNSDAATSLLNAIARPGERYGAEVESYPTLDKVMAVLWGDDESTGRIRKLNEGFKEFFSPKERAQILEETKGAGAHYSPFFIEDDIRAHSEFNEGFHGKVVALISTDCVSECDAVASMLKNSKRAILLGTPTQGTGIGLEAEAHAWTNGMFTLTIPNYLFGTIATPVGDDLKNHLLSFDHVDELNIENRPVQPDVYYDQSFEDLMGTGQGWQDQIAKVLNYGSRTQN